MTSNEIHKICTIFATTAVFSQLLRYFSPGSHALLRHQQCGHTGAKGKQKSNRESKGARGKM